MACEAVKAHWWLQLALRVNDAGWIDLYSPCASEKEVTELCDVWDKMLGASPRPDFKVSTGERKWYSKPILDDNMEWRAFSLPADTYGGYVLRVLSR